MSIKFLLLVTVSIIWLALPLRYSLMDYMMGTHKLKSRLHTAATVLFISVAYLGIYHGI